ncbi:MAG: class I SAM-dependent methyltransferase [Phormidesmis sp.]
MLQKLRRKLQPKKYQLTYDPALLPPLNLMRQEGISVLEEWFRWGEEWSMVLRVYGEITRNSSVLEIGCGLGRIAFPLRFILSSNGSYEGFEICQEKVDFLKRNFQPLYPNFNFSWANLHNTYYNPSGLIEPTHYQFPYPDETFDLVYAASVFTHMLPETTSHYFSETARVLKPGGRVVFSVFLLDNYRPSQPRPLGFNRSDFNFDHTYGEYGDSFAIAAPDNPEQMTAYRLQLIENFAADANLSWNQKPIPGLWSGTNTSWVGAQDLILLEKSN